MLPVVTGRCGHGADRQQVDQQGKENAVHFFVMESLSYVICAVKQAPSAKCTGVCKSIIPHLVRIGKVCLEDAGKCRGRVLQLEMR